MARRAGGTATTSTLATAARRDDRARTGDHQPAHRDTRRRGARGRRRPGTVARRAALRPPAVRGQLAPGRCDPAARGRRDGDPRGLRRHCRLPAHDRARSPGDQGGPGGRAARRPAGPAGTGVRIVRRADLHRRVPRHAVPGRRNRRAGRRGAARRHRGHDAGVRVDRRAVRHAPARTDDGPDRGRERRQRPRVRRVARGHAPAWSPSSSRTAWGPGSSPTGSCTAVRARRPARSATC